MDVMPSLLREDAGKKGLLVLLCFFLSFPLVADPVTTVILVRHAEKLSDTMADDVALNDEGKARADELARVLGPTKIDTIYTTQWLRTRQTAEPTAKAKGITPLVTQTGKTYAVDLAGKIKAEGAGKTTLVVGHSNTTRDVLRALGIADAPYIPDTQYDDLFVVTLSGETAKVVSLRYGSRSVNPPRILALGDSYTIGESVAPDERWPNVLARELDVPEPQIIAKTGWTTDELNSAIDAAKPQGTFDLVTLLIGVNNQYRGRSADEYRAQFSALLRRAIGFAGGNPKNVIVVSIPDWGVTPFAEGRDRAQIANEIDRFNEINREETERASAHYVDVTPVSRETDPALVAGDKLHPSALMYRRWVDLIVPTARAIIAR